MEAQVDGDWWTMLSHRVIYFALVWVFDFQFRHHFTAKARVSAIEAHVTSRCNYHVCHFLPVDERKVTVKEAEWFFKLGSVVFFPSFVLGYLYRPCPCRFFGHRRTFLEMGARSTLVYH